MGHRLLLSVFTYVLGTGSVVHWAPFGRPISTSNQSTFGNLLVMRPASLCLGVLVLTLEGALSVLSLYHVTRESTADKFGRQVPSTPEPEGVRCILPP